MTSPAINIGTSGFHYDHWQGVFYPDGLPKTEWLDFYSKFFPIVEINSTFYSLPSADTINTWKRKTDERFRFALNSAGVLISMPSSTMMQTATPPIMPRACSDIWMPDYPADYCYKGGKKCRNCRVLNT